MERESSNRSSKSRQYAELLDNKFTIPGTDIRFGIDSLMGIIPGAGDWVGGVLSLYFLFAAASAGGNTAVLGRMFVNVLLDVVIGSIPVLGDLFDLYWRSNLRNADILEELERDPQKAKTTSRLLVWGLLILMIIVIIALLVLVGWLVVEFFDLFL